jgi:hypothetical protein
MSKALENAHPQFHPEFVPSSKTQAYASLLGILKEKPPQTAVNRNASAVVLGSSLPLHPKAFSNLPSFVCKMITVTKYRGTIWSLRMALKKSELYSFLRSGCDELRGGMDAGQYKDYVLLKYVSDKYPGVPYAPICRHVPSDKALHPSISKLF